MIKEGKFGSSESISIATLAICNKLFYTSPGFVTRTVGTTGWLMTLISNGTAIAFFALLCLLMKKYPRKNILEIYDTVLGRVAGFIFSFSLMATFLYLCGINAREFVDVMKIYVFRITPPGVLLIPLLIVVAYSAHLGLESIVRVGKMAAYISLAVYTLLLILSTGFMNWAHIHPIFGYGLGVTAIQGVIRSTAYGEVLILAVFAGSLQGFQHFKKAGFVSLLISGFIISAGVLSFTLTFGYIGTQEIVAPIYVMSRLIKYGAFFQRLDPMFLFLWFITSILIISIFFYTALSIFCTIFKMQDKRPAIIPMCILVLTLAMLPSNFPDIIDEFIHGVRLYGNIPLYILPIITLIVSAFKKKKGEEQCAG